MLETYKMNIILIIVSFLGGILITAGVMILLLLVMNKSQK